MLTLRLFPGQSLIGEGDRAGIAFVEDIDGLQLSSDNAVCDIRLHASHGKRAIFDDTSVDSLGRITLRGVAATGRVQILVRDNIRAGHVEVDGLDIAAADARGETDRPHGYGVYVLQRESSATHPIAASTLRHPGPERTGVRDGLSGKLRTKTAPTSPMKGVQQREWKRPMTWTKWYRLVRHDRFGGIGTLTL